MLKRILDVVGSALLLAVLSPLLLVVAVAIRLDSRGPVFYAQDRVGQGGRIFRLYKFRSMVVHADRQGPLLTGKDDPRITRLGQILRALRLDELPQLLNVLKGDMSLVGPRPEVSAVVERYTAAERQVLRVKPGLTGPTQLAWLDEAEAYPDGVDRVQYYTEHIVRRKLATDLAYVRDRSLAADIGYLVRTPVVVAEAAFRARLNWPAALPQAARLAADCLGVAIANLVSFAVRFDGMIPPEMATFVSQGLPLAVAIYAVIFILLGTHRSIWRYASVEDLRLLIKAAVLAGVLHAGVVLIIDWRPYPRSVLVATALLTVLINGGLRLAFRLHARGASVLEPAKPRRIVILGAGATGEAIAREMRASGAAGYEVLGFVDDDPAMQGQTIHGLPVLGRTEDLPALARTRQVEEVIVAVPSAAVDDFRRINESCARAGVTFRTLPSFVQLLRGEGQLRYLRDLKVDELLSREWHWGDEERVRRLLDGRRVMVTGAGGSIGSELCRQVLALGARHLIMVERAENALHDIMLEMRGRYGEAAITAALADVKHVPRMSEIFHRHRPEIVFHAAAYKHVPILEDHPAEAVLNNIVGTRRLAEMARRFGTEAFVFISTDKAAKPKNLMGATKRIGEMYMTALSRASQRAPGSAAMRAFVVRFGNVLGSNGSVVPLFKRQVEHGEPLTITDPHVSRFFMTVSEAVGLVLQSATIATTGDVFILDMGEPRKIADLADDVVLAMGLSPAEVGRRYVGLRPGEKMHETLWEDGEEVRQSEHERIFCAVQPNARDLAEMELLLGELETLAVTGNVARLLEKVHELVPSYTPSLDRARSVVPEAGARYRVLVVDDDEFVGELLVSALQQTYEVSCVRSGAEGFEAIGRQVPHLILLDLKLGGESGLDLCRTLRAHHEFGRIPIIMITGYGDRESAVAALSGGADDYVTKPFNLDELQARIDAVLRRSAEHIGRTGERSGAL
jgi:FlaA1/EpsC-like NDP-sugar epimerase/lipopolysaccharide/colanic/teichoic acid biosynthesis glycosyltransferase/ActR/RegA family two-component response regulator